MRRWAAVVLVAVGCGREPESNEVSVVGPAIVAEQTVSRLEEARIEQTKMECERLLAAVELHLVSRGTCPANVAALVEARMLPGAVKDPWDSEFVVACAGEKPQVSSPGPDRAAETADDIRCVER